MKAALIANVFSSKNTNEHEIYELCLQRNVSLPFSHRHIFVESDVELALSTAYHAIQINNRPTFADFLDLASTNDLRGHLIVFANADIVLDRSIFDLGQLVDQGTVCCISRYERDGSMMVSAKSSQDCWVLRGHRLPNTLIAQARFFLGLLGAENRLANIFHSYGYKLFNPCFSIKNIHAGSSDSDYRPSLQSREKRLFGAYTYVHPCGVDQLASKEEKLEHALYTVPIDRAFEAAQRFKK
jgi:hypothetical protein